MGQVFLGRSPGGRLVAVKVIRPELAADPDFRVRFGRELAAARAVSGLFTAPVVDADLQGETPWLATAYVAGPSLAGAVAAQGPLPVASVLALTAGLAEGLRAIHAAGLVHRDLKPSNVLLAADGPRVIDFGISQAAEASSLTQSGMVLGSPGFMSPEQAEGREVGPSSDVFSLGAVLVFAATGGGPFGTGATPALLYRVVHSQPELANVPPEIRALIGRCLAKDPSQRPSTEHILSAVGNTLPAERWLPVSFAAALSGYATHDPYPGMPPDAGNPPPAMTRNADLADVYLPGTSGGPPTLTAPGQPGRKPLPGGLEVSMQEPEPAWFQPPGQVGNYSTQNKPPGSGTSLEQANQQVAKPGVIPLRPIGIGQILHGSFAYIRRSPQATLGFTASLATITAVLMTLVPILLTHFASQLTTDVELGIYIGSYLLLGFIASAILDGVLTVVIGESVLGHTIGARKTWRAARPRMPALLLASGLRILCELAPWTLFAGLVAVLDVATVPAVVREIVLIPYAIVAACLSIWAYITLSMVTPVVVLECGGPMHSLARSWQLVRGSFWRVLGILLLGTIIFTTAGEAIQIPALFLSRLLGGAVNIGDAVYAFAGTAIVILGSVIASIVSRPLLEGVGTLLYVDLRIRKESLHLILQTMSGQRVSAHGGSAAIR